MVNHQHGGLPSPEPSKKAPWPLILQQRLLALGHGAPLFSSRLCLCQHLSKEFNFTFQSLGVQVVLLGVR
jgi:hypothetical protein